MSAALRRTHGVAHYEPGRAFDGYTLFALMSGRNVWLIDMRGVIEHRWRVENLPGIRDADLDPDRDGDFNALVPKRLVRSPRASQRSRTRYEVGEVVHGGH